MLYLSALDWYSRLLFPSFAELKETTLDPDLVLAVARFAMKNLSTSTLPTGTVYLTL